jgi:O-acetyl-ADP-ribose deacetylase (regulator of RNase III)
MIEFVDGNFFDHEADIRINTVNCVGVMGAGVALAFKNKYPTMFKEYVSQCKKGLIKPGQPQVWQEGSMFEKGVTIINFPTKNHWKNPSEYQYIEDGLKWLRDYLFARENVTITLPALGCGHGGLDWGKVKNLIKQYLKDVPGNILVFSPDASKNIKNKPNQIELARIGIKIIKHLDIDYPEALWSYTTRDMYILGDESPEKKFDITLIISSNPDEKERNIVTGLMNTFSGKNMRILLGYSSFERKIAEANASSDMTIVHFTPSGIGQNIPVDFEANSHRCTIFSMGNPDNLFDKKEYIPSILARLYMADTIIVTTPKIDWIGKQASHFAKNNDSLFYISYSEQTNDERAIMAAIAAKSIGRAQKTGAPNFAPIAERIAA